MPSETKFTPRQFKSVTVICALAIFIAFGMLYRTSSQGDYSDTYPKGFRGGTCTIETNDLIIGYSGYYLPAHYEDTRDPIRSPYVPIQCGRVPEPATLNITIDLLYPESAREFPFAQRLVKLEMIEDQQREHEVLAIPAQRYPSGVITQALRLSEPGQYVLYLNGKDLTHRDIHISVPLKVGFNWKDYLRIMFSAFLKKE